MKGFRALALDIDERTAAFEGFARILRNGPVLRRVGLSVSAFGVDPEDLGDPADEELPFLRLIPSNDRAGLGPQNTTESPILVDVHQVVAGAGVADGWKLWRAVERTIFGSPGDSVGQEAARQALYAVGISGVEVLRAAGGVDMAGAAAGATRRRTEGQLRLIVYVPTPGLT